MRDLRAISRLGACVGAVGLDTYVDENGFIDVQTLTCDQLANTYQEDANALANCILVGTTDLPRSISII